MGDLVVKDICLLKEEIDNLNDNIYSLKNSSELNLVEAIKEIEDNLHLAKQIDYYKGIASGYIILGILYSYNGQTSKCSQALNSALKVHTKYNLHEKLLADIYAAYVVFYLESKRDYKEAIKYCQKGLALSKKNMFDSLIWKFTLNFGVAYLELQMLDQAEKSFEETLSIGINEGNKRAQLYSYANLAELYYKKNDLALARENHKKAYRLALRLDNIIVLSATTHLSASIEFELGNTKKACQLLQKTIERLKNNKQKTWITYLSLELIDFYIRADEFQKAKQILDEISGNIKILESDEYSSKYFGFLSAYYEHIGDFHSSLINYKVHHMYYKALRERQEKEVINTIKEETMQKTIESLRVLSEVGQEIISYNDLDDVFIEVNKHISSIFKNYNFVVALKQNDRLNCIYYRYLDKNLPLFSYKIGNKNSFLCATIRNDKTIVLNDLMNEYSDHVENIIQLDPNKNVPQSLLSIPLRVLDKSIGVLQVQAYKKNVFNRRNIEFFSIVASYTAVAIRNSMQVKELKKMVNYDSLTGLKNFHYFNKMLYYIIQDTDYKYPISLLIIDIDHFKDVNDTYGHSIGNECLQKVGKMIKEEFETKADIVARIGGEEFGILLTDTSEDHVLYKANRLLDSFRNISVFQEDEIFISVSIGCAINANKVVSVDELFDLADGALYKAKENGRNQIVTLKY